MPEQTKEHYVAKFSAYSRLGHPFKNSGASFFGAGFLTFLVCLLLMIFIEPVRNIIVVVGVCTLVATIAMVAAIVFNVKFQKASLGRMTAQVNAFIIELTGDPNAQVSSGKVRALMQNKRCVLPLHINGVPGATLKTVPKSNGKMHVVALLTTPDYGLESFDLLLKSARKR